VDANATAATTAGASADCIDDPLASVRGPHVAVKQIGVEIDIGIDGGGCVDSDEDFGSGSGSGEGKGRDSGSGSSSATGVLPPRKEGRKERRKEGTGVLPPTPFVVFNCLKFLGNLAHKPVICTQSNSTGVRWL
jgi:hypothetical protein